VFEMPIAEARAKIEEKLEELERRLSGPVGDQYRRVKSRHERTVVPVVDGVCYGCFMAVPTAVAADADRNIEIETCDNCGRFLYHLD